MATTKKPTTKQISDLQLASKLAAPSMTAPATAKVLPNSFFRRSLAALADLPKTHRLQAFLAVMLTAIAVTWAATLVARSDASFLMGAPIVTFVVFSILTVALLGSIRKSSGALVGLFYFLPLVYAVLILGLAVASRVEATERAQRLQNELETRQKEEKRQQDEREAAKAREKAASDLRDELKSRVLMAKDRILRTALLLAANDETKPAAAEIIMGWKMAHTDNCVAVLSSFDNDHRSSVKGQLERIKKSFEAKCLAVPIPNENPNAKQLTLAQEVMWICFRPLPAELAERIDKYSPDLRDALPLFDVRH